jgi:hypothetical protein
VRSYGYFDKRNFFVIITMKLDFEKEKAKNKAEGG